MKTFNIVTLSIIAVVLIVIAYYWIKDFRNHLNKQIMNSKVKFITEYIKQNGLKIEYLPNETQEQVIVRHGSYYLEIFITYLARITGYCDGDYYTQEMGDYEIIDKEVQEIGLYVNNECVELTDSEIEYITEVAKELI